MFKRYLLALTLATLAAATVPFAVAQDSGQQPESTADQQSQPSTTPGGPGRGRQFDPAKRTQRMAKHLNLTSDQQAKVQDILTSEQSQIQKLRADSSLSRQDRRSKMMDIHKTSNDQIRALLNPDQQKTWDQMQQRREQRMKERHGGQGAGSPPDSGQPPQ